MCGVRGSDVLGKLASRKSICSDQGPRRRPHSTAGFLALAPHFMEGDVGLERNLFKESKTLSSAPYTYTHPLFPVLPGRILK